MDRASVLGQSQREALSRRRKVQKEKTIREVQDQGQHHISGVCHPAALCVPQRDGFGDAFPDLAALLLCDCCSEGKHTEGEWKLN